MYLGYLRFKQTFYQFRMGSGYQHLRSLGCISYFKNIYFYAFCRIEMLSRDHLFFVQNGIYLTKIYAYALTHVTLHNTGNDFSFLAEIFIVKYFSLFFANFLQNNVFGILGSNTAKGSRLNLHIDNVADFIGRIDHFCICQADLLYAVLNLFRNGLCCHYMEITGLTIDRHCHVIRFTEMVLAGL